MDFSDKTPPPPESGECNNQACSPRNEDKRPVVERHWPSHGKVDEAWPKLPGYEILEVLGRGGMGVVYKARQSRLNRLVALKMIGTAACAGVREQSRFLAEAEAAAQLQHANIVPIYEIAHWEGQPYFTTELVEGGDLAKRIVGKPQNARDSAALIDALARGIHFSHTRGIIHRDLKPSNILLADDGILHPKITDFGLAKRLEDDLGLTRTGAVVGTPSYMAPEQASAKEKEIGPKTDIYALGVILYELLTGRPPFLADCSAETLNQVLYQEPVPPRRLQPKVPRDIETICLKCLEKSPERRYASAELLAEDLNRFLENRPITARSVSIWERGWRWCRRRPAVAALTTILVASVATALIVVSTLAVRIGNQNDQLALTNQELADKNKALGEAIGVSKSAVATAEQARDVATQRKQQVEHVLYVRQINLAKEAWDRGDVKRARELLAPYQSIPDKKNLRSFAWNYLWKLVNSANGLVVGSHNSAVRQGILLHDGSKALTLDDAGNVILWDAKGRKKHSEWKLDGDHHRISQTNAKLDVWSAVTIGKEFSGNGLGMTPDGSWVAGYGRSIWTTNLQGSEKPRKVVEHDAPLTTMSLSSDGRIAVAGDPRGSVVAWDLESGHRLWTYNDMQFPSPVRSIAFDSREKVIWVGDGARLRALEASTGKPRESHFMPNGIRSLAISPDGKTVAVSPLNREGSILFWDVSQQHIRGECRGHNDQITSLQFSKDGKELISASLDNTVRVWTSSSGRLLKTLRGHEGHVMCVCMGTDGQTVLSGSEDKTARLWNLAADQECQSRCGADGVGYVNDAAFVNEGNSVVSVGWRDDFQGAVDYWNLKDNTKSKLLQYTPTTAMCVEFSPDGRWLAAGEITSQSDSTCPSRVRVWNIDSGEVKATLNELRGQVGTIAFSDDGCRVTAGGGDYMSGKIRGQVGVLDIANGQSWIWAPETHGCGIPSFDPRTGEVIAVFASAKFPGGIGNWHPTDESSTSPLVANTKLDKITGAVFGRNDEMITAHGDVMSPATNSNVIGLRVWDLTKKELIGEFPKSHLACISAVAISRDGKVLASGDWNGHVQLWNVADQKERTNKISKQQWPINSLALDSSGRRLAITAWDIATMEPHCATIYDVESGMQLSRIDLKNGAGQGIAFSPDGSHLAVSTAAGGVFLYRTDHYEPERCLTPEVDPTRENWHRASITAVAVASHSGAVFTGSRDKTVKRWDLATGRVAETVVTTTKPVSCLACSGDGTILAVGTGIAEESFEPGELRIIDINTHKTKCAAADPKGAITSVSVSTDGRIVAACQTIVQAGKGQNREASLFEPESGQVTPLEINGLPQSVAISPDSRFLAVGCANGTIVVRSLRLTEKVLEIPPIIQAHEEGVASIAISPDAKTIGTIGGDRIVRLWDAATGEELISFQSNGRLHFIRFSPDGNCLVVGGGEANRAISRVWVTETSQ